MIAGKIIHYKFIQYNFYDGIVWFKIFGYGLAFKNLNKHRLLFSERNGYTKTYRIGNISIKVLKKRKEL